MVFQGTDECGDLVEGVQMKVERGTVAGGNRNGNERSGRFVPGTPTGRFDLDGKKRDERNFGIVLGQPTDDGSLGDSEVFGGGDEGNFMIAVKPDDFEPSFDGNAGVGHASRSEKSTDSQGRPNLPETPNGNQGIIPPRARNDNDAIAGVDTIPQICGDDSI